MKNWKWLWIGLALFAGGCIGTAYAQRADGDLIAFIKAGIGTHVTATDPLPTTIISGAAMGGVWSESQNHVLAQCGAGACPGAGCTALDTATSKAIVIKPGTNAVDNVWCDVDGAVDVLDGFRVGQNGEGIGTGQTDPANVVCCGEGAATFTISVLVEN
ncbi:hypothetical protein LCGC14_2656640 [marine sediment metagenome]|uniref:Uncharacterized protein n=1 Tax=marine sediment metagenome TaxID=412755 RepID=A0A0F9CK96_9ZZZZ